MRNTFKFKGVTFTKDELRYGWITRDGHKFYVGNIFDTPYDNAGHRHSYKEIGSFRIFYFGIA